MRFGLVGGQPQGLRARMRFVGSLSAIAQVSEAASIRPTHAEGANNKRSGGASNVGTTVYYQYSEGPENTNSGYEEDRSDTGTSRQCRTTATAT